MFRSPFPALFVFLFSVTACASGDSQIYAAERALLDGADAAEAVRYAGLALEAPGLEASNRARAHEDRGLAHLVANEDALALTDLDLAVQSAPERRDYLLMRGVGYRRTGQYEKSIGDYDGLLQKMPRDGAGFLAYRNRAATYLAMGQPEKAVAEYTSWITFNQSQYLRSGQAPSPPTGSLIDSQYAGGPPEAYFGLCFARAVMGQLQQAMADCATSLSTGVHTADMDFYTIDVEGYILLKRGQYGEAHATFDRVLARKPKLASALYGRGLTKQAVGDAGGNADIEAARKLDPKIADTFDTFRPSLEYWILPPWPDTGPD